MSGSNIARAIDMAVPANAARQIAVADQLGLPLESRLSLITTVEALAAIEKNWLELEQSCNSASGLFQSFAWLHSWAKFYVTEDSPFELCVVTGFEGDRLVFAWPLMKCREGMLTILRWATDPFGQYGDVLAEPGQRVQAWMAQALRFISSLRSIDGIRLRHVRHDALCAAFLAERFDNALAPELAPYLDLKAFADEAAYDARYTSVQRKRRKKIRKSLEQIGELDFHQLPPGSLADVAIEEAVQEKTKWLEARGRQNRVLKCPANVKFLKDLSRRRQDGFQTVISELTADGEPLSWEIGFNYRGTHYGYITSHREELTDLSPSRLHMDLSQRLSLKQGMARFDLMVPNDAHKESWSSDKVACDDHYLPLSTKGHLYGALYLKSLRPRIRRAYYSAPSWLLKWMSGVIAIVIAQ